METLLASIHVRKAALDRLRPVSGDALRHPRKYHDIELTWTSNMIEGDTLAHRETAELIEHGITVGGKTLKEHLKVVDHHDALSWMRDLAARTVAVGESVVRELHRRIVARAEPARDTPGKPLTRPPRVIPHAASVLIRVHSLQENASRARRWP